MLCALELVSTTYETCAKATLYEMKQNMLNSTLHKMTKWALLQLLLLLFCKTIIPQSAIKKIMLQGDKVYG